MKSLLVLSLVLSLSLANPGLQASLSVSDLNQVLMIAYAFGLTSAHFELGDYDINYASTIGVINADFSDIQVGSISVDYTNSVFSFQSPDSITYNIYDLSAIGTANYSVSFEAIPLPAGHANFSLSETNLTADFSLTSSNGQPQLTLNSYSFQLGPIVLDTTLPPEYNTALNQIIAHEEPILEGLIPGLLSRYLPLINTALAGLNLNVAVPGTDVAIDLSLVENPTILEDSILVLGLAGTVTQGGQAVNGGQAVEIPAQGVITEGIQIGITDAVVNSLLIPLWPMFKYDVEALPEWLGGELTTDTLEDILPQLSETFGKGKAVILSISSSGPIAYWTNGNINVDANLIVDVKVRTGLFHWTIGATFELKADLILSASVQNNVAHVHISHLSFPSIKVLRNFIGTIIIDLLRPAIDIVKDIVVGKVNDKLKDVVRDR